MPSHSDFRTAGLFSPETLLVVIARTGHRLGMTRQFLEFLANRIMLPQECEKLRVYTPTRHDVFVPTFAKSGTNWAMQMCLQTAWRGRAEFDHIHHLVAWPEVSYPELVSFDDPRPRQSSPTSLRVIKTHLPAASVPYSPSARYVTIIRDPKEVLVSAYYFVLGLLGLGDRVDRDEWFELLDSGGLFTQRWAEHTAGFWRWRERPNVYLRTYDQVHADRRAAVTDIVELLGVELEPAEFDAVLERSSFAYMKAHDRCFAPPRSVLVRPDKHPNMVRRGRSGQADELFDQRQLAAIDVQARAWLRELGSDFPYDELFGARSRPDHDRV